MWVVLSNVSRAAADDTCRMLGNRKEIESLLKIVLNFYVNPQFDSLLLAIVVFPSE